MAAEEGTAAPDATDVSPLISLLSDPAMLVGLGLIAAGTAFYVASRPAPVKPPLPLDNQSIEMPVSALPHAVQLERLHGDSCKYTGVMYSPALPPPRF